MQDLESGSFSDNFPEGYSYQVRGTECLNDKIYTDITVTIHPNATVSTVQSYRGNSCYTICNAWCLLFTLILSPKYEFWWILRIGSWLISRMLYIFMMIYIVKCYDILVLWRVKLKWESSMVNLVWFANNNLDDLFMKTLTLEIPNYRVLTLTSYQDYTIRSWL